jgi:tRNA dimethylallyltransferase
VRALEVCLLSGARFSDQQARNPPPYTVVQIGLTSERERLYARADQRFEQMMANGFLDEVRSLLDAGYARTLPAMTGLGYAELAAHLLDGEPLAEAVQRAKYSTHHFIRRQLTWFRGHDSGVTWYDVAALEPDALIERAAHTLEGMQHPR